MKHYPSIERLQSMIAESDPFTLAVRRLRGEVQQHLLYAASNDVFFGDVPFGGKANLPKGITLHEAQELADRVQRSDYAFKHWPKFAAGVRVLVDNDTSLIENDMAYILSHEPGAKYGGAFTDDHPVIEKTGGARIHLADNGFAMQPQVVLHELGHVIEAYERGTSPVTAPTEGHGAAFARTNIQIIHEFMWPERAKELEQAFTFAGVEVAPDSQSQPHRSIR